MSQTELPDKLFFKIGEVAQLVGVKPHVLRYWESEFPALKPMKTRGSHRMYRRKDVELAVLLRRLLHQEGLTVAGAKKRLKELGRHRVQSEPDPEAVREVSLRAEFLSLRKQLADLLVALDRLMAPEEEVSPAKAGAKAGAEAGRATVTAAVPSSVPVQNTKSTSSQINPCNER